MGKNTFKIAFEDGTTKTASIEIIVPKDVVMFVAGTTDPVNTTAAKHQANKDYWRTDVKDLKNLHASVKELKPQFHDLHIEDQFFSWSGDNNNADRTEGANRLLDLFYRLYPNWKDDDVYFHLIGHSHGGNVINEFTNVIANDGGFPKKWKVKSITYLSTPFFKEQHQLNHKNLHPECKLINVYNEYDITQRFVADFSMRNLETILTSIDDKGFEKAKETLNSVNFETLDHLKGFVVNNHTEGPAVWNETITLLQGFNELIEAFKNSVSFIGNSSITSPEKLELLNILEALTNWSITQRAVFQANAQGRNGGYGRSEYFEDLDLLTALTLLNRIFAIEDDEKDSYLINLLNTILTEENTGLIDMIDDTSWTPKNQVNGKFEIVDINITDLDIYDSRNKKNNFEKFAKGIEDSIARNDENSVKEALIRLLSQFVSADALDDVRDKLWWFGFIVWGATDTQLNILHTRLGVYQELVEIYNADLIAESDMNDDTLDIKPGSIPYLAMTAHSLSHTKLFDDSKHNVKDALMSSFSSGKNPGFKG
ncbi:hypothetical protein [Lacinutrix chionoecetis]